MTTETECKNEGLINQVNEIKTVNSENEANDLLRSGWILLATGKGQEQTGKEDIHCYFKFCLGKVLS